MADSPEVTGTPCRTALRLWSRLPCRMWSSPRLCLPGDEIPLNGLQPGSVLTVLSRGTCRWSMAAMASPVPRGIGVALDSDSRAFATTAGVLRHCMIPQSPPNHLQRSALTGNDFYILKVQVRWWSSCGKLEKKICPTKGLCSTVLWFGRAFVLHEWTCCARVTASWASSWDELPISTRCGRTREFLVFSCSQSTDGLVPNSSGCWASISSGTCWAGRDTGTIPGISSNSLARISGRGSTVDGYLRWTDDELMIL